MIEPWEHLTTRAGHDYRIFSTRLDLCRSPRTRTDHEFVVVEAPDWVNVIALTPEDEVLLVRQYRFGTREVTLEIPGGAVDRGEDFVSAGVRELREETGFEGDQVRLLGTVTPNPAFIQNRCGTLLVTGARRVDEPRPDGTEILEVERRPLGDIPRLIAGGQIDHALVVAAFHWLEVAKSTQP